MEEKDKCGTQIAIWANRDLPNSQNKKFTLTRTCRKNARSEIKGTREKVANRKKDGPQKVTLRLKSLITMLIYLYNCTPYLRQFDTKARIFS